MANNTFFKLAMPNAEVYYFPDFLEKKKADELFKTLLHSLTWQQDKITVFGKTYDQPRLTALYAINKNPYTYSSLTMHPKKFTEELHWIKSQITQKTHLEFSSCLANLYRDGNDSNGWHADNEKELGKNPIIASISLGAVRNFKFRHVTDKSLKQNLILAHGSLLLMKGATQHYWKHELPKTKKKIGPRINLTYRTIYP